MKYKRFMAYFIDVLIVGFIAGSLSNIRVLNPYYDNYLETKEKLVDEYKNINEDNMKDIMFSDNNIELYRDLNKYNSVTSVISIVCYLLYFVGFQKWNNDQSVGKKLMKIKIVNVDGKNISIFDYLIRTIVVYNLFFTSLCVFVTFRFSGNMFLNLLSLFTSLGSIITFVTYLMILCKKEGRGLHDILGHTKVISE